MGIKGCRLHTAKHTARYRQCIKAATAAAGGQSGEAKTWDRLTNMLVSSSSIPFSILVLPQVVQNWVQMAAGNTAALSVISWEGYLSGLLGNTLMCSHFANSGERSAVGVQLIGIVNNMAVLLQVALAAWMPRAVFVGVAAAVTIAVSINLARMQHQSSHSDQSTDGWRRWQLVSGIAGLAVVPQVLYNIMFPAAPSYLPGALTLLLLTLWFLVPANRHRGPSKLQVEQLPGIASTLLFALSPLPQLVRNFLDAGSLEGLSVGTMLLALTGNALMVPRALWVRDPVWLAGTSWACCAGWGQLLSMFLRTSPASGLRYLEPGIFGAVTVALLAYFTYVLTKDSSARR